LIQCLINNFINKTVTFVYDPLLPMSMGRTPLKGGYLACRLENANLMNFLFIELAPLWEGCGVNKIINFVKTNHNAGILCPRYNR